MRILFAVPYVPSLIRVRPYNFIRALADRHAITVLAMSMGGEAQDVPSLQAYCEHVEVVPFDRIAALRSCATAVLRGDPLQAAVCHSPAFGQHLDALLAGRRFDVVHVEHLRAAHLGTRLPASVPVVFDSVDCISLLLERTIRSSHDPRQRVLAMLELRRTRAYEARLLHRFDQVAVTSSDDAGALRALAPTAAVTIVPNGVDLEYFRPLAGPREPATLVFSGKMSYHANATAALHFVRHIFPLIREARPAVRLRIVGSRPPRAIQELARDPAITVTGHVADLRDTLAQATIAVCPVTVKVGIQNKVLEAMAMGLPVVCSRLGAEGLAAEPGQDLLVADDAAEFARHVGRLLAEPRLRDAIGRAGRRYVETHHRWGTAAGQLEALYQDARASRRGPASLAAGFPGP
jgi:polysaccharide biosynthesis protein PslH